MKKWLFFMMAGLLAFTLSACGASNESSGSKGEEKKEPDKKKKRLQSSMSMAKRKSTKILRTL